MLNFALLHVRLVFLSSHFGLSPYIRFHFAYILYMDKNYPERHVSKGVRSLLNEQTISSYEIAEITGRRHSNVMASIREMEPAWRNVQGLNFKLMFKTRKLPSKEVRANEKYIHCY